MPKICSQSSANSATSPLSPTLPPRPAPRHLAFLLWTSPRLSNPPFQPSLFISFLQGTDLNEYEHAAIADLLSKGHADPASKIQSGVAAFRIKLNTKYEENTRCFFIIRADGSEDDFSYIKCLSKLFPGSIQQSKGGSKSGGGRGGRDGGRGRGRGKR